MLLKEYSKVKQILRIMKGCSVRCDLKFSEKGITEDKPDALCFKNCVFKANEFSGNML